MACLIKAPDGPLKGCVSFTTPERDQLISKDPKAREAVAALKSRFVIGLHHNWHDHNFAYDPLFDFSMAGEGDLIERDKKDFPRIGIDACNFAPPYFGSKLRTEPFWDVLNVSRAVEFKGVPEFFNAIREIYDQGRLIRVLYLCPVPPADKNETTVSDIRTRYEALFSPHERQFFNLMTMEWDYPFPLDLETLAFFYRSSKVYVHPAPNERRSRTAAYAWADKMPVVARANVASILPPDLRRRPFFFGFDEYDGMAEAILQALGHTAGDPQWTDVGKEFSAKQSGARLSQFLDELANSQKAAMSSHPINISQLDIRLGRHHIPVPGANGLSQNLESLCRTLVHMTDLELVETAKCEDPEFKIAADNSRPKSSRLRRWLGA